MTGAKVVWALVLGSMLAITGCGDDAEGMGGAGGTGGSSGAGGAAGTGGAGAMGGTGGAGGAINTPPESTIVTPASDSGNSNMDFVYDGFDDDLGLWYKDVMFEGLGVDEEDGTLTGDALVWKTNQADIQAEVLGTGANPTLRLYSDDCFGVEHIIVLEATDSDGETTMSMPRTLFIWTLC